MPALLRIEHLSKVFPGQVALDDVDLTIEAGTTHALVGQNGSGKSTLIKILAGYHQPTGDEATATYYGNDPTGEPLELGDGRAAERDGIRFVHQDLGLVEGLTAVENLALGNGFTTRYGKISWRADVVRARRALAAIGFESVDVKIPVGALAPAQKTGVALGPRAARMGSRRAPARARRADGVAARPRRPAPVRGDPATEGTWRRDSRTCRITSTRCSRSPTRCRCCVTGAASSPNVSTRSITTA